MRVGSNPNKERPSEYGIKPVVFAIVTHLPNVTTAYHSKRMEVIKLCIDSMRRNAFMDHTLMIWDNGSCDMLTRWIESEVRPDIFIKSPNIGLTSAKTALAGMMPPESVMCYSDDDMYFYPGWFEPQYELLTKFPNVSIVTGYPVRTAFRWGCDNTKKWAKRYARLETGLFIPQQWEDDFAISVGRELAWHKEYTRNDVDILIRYNGMEAFATSHHCQFVARAGRIAELKRFDNKSLGEEKTFDIELDKRGLRLATTQRLTRHIGNVLDEKLKSEIMQYA